MPFAPYRHGRFTRQDAVASARPAQPAVAQVPSARDVASPASLAADHGRGARTGSGPRDALTVSCACGGSCPRCRGAMANRLRPKGIGVARGAAPGEAMTHAAPAQPALAVGGPGTAAEREADRIAAAALHPTMTPAASGETIAPRKSAPILNAAPATRRAEAFPRIRGV